MLILATFSISDIEIFPHHVQLCFNYIHVVIIIISNLQRHFQSHSCENELKFLFVNNIVYDLEETIF